MSRKTPEQRQCVKNILPAAYRQSWWDKNESYLPVISYLANFSQWEPRLLFSGPVVKSISLALRQRHQHEKQKTSKPASSSKIQEAPPRGNLWRTQKMLWLSLRWARCRGAIPVLWEHRRDSQGSWLWLLQQLSVPRIIKASKKHCYCCHLRDFDRKKCFTKLDSVTNERLRLLFPYSDRFFTLICLPVSTFVHLRHVLYSSEPREHYSCCCFGTSEPRLCLHFRN